MSPTNSRKAKTKANTKSNAKTRKQARPDLSQTRAQKNLGYIKNPESRKTHEKIDIICPPSEERKIRKIIDEAYSLEERQKLVKNGNVTIVVKPLQDSAGNIVGQKIELDKGRSKNRSALVHEGAHYNSAPKKKPKVSPGKETTSAKARNKERLETVKNARLNLLDTYREYDSYALSWHPDIVMTEEDLFLDPFRKKYKVSVNAPADTVIKKLTDKEFSDYKRYMRETAKQVRLGDDY